MIARSTLCGAVVFATLTVSVSAVAAPVTTDTTRGPNTQFASPSITTVGNGDKCAACGTPVMRSYYNPYVDGGL